VSQKKRPTFGLL